jgi:hypothetical protein
MDRTHAARVMLVATLPLLACDGQGTVPPVVAVLSGTGSKITGWSSASGDGNQLFITVSTTAAECPL